ncbi:selenide, water dikinase SelD [Helicobacter himalayensis]|uniref:selenide, water dikinase SelD n=1 Tax=Helicobacter himalayensis TaxID=1591088 RepID=UPI003D6DE36B
MGPEDLKQITTALHQPKNENLLIGFETSEDCGALRLENVFSQEYTLAKKRAQIGQIQDEDLSTDEPILLASVDFITPIIDDPYMYGAIAAANSLSDIFACGGKALSALNLFMWDSARVEVKYAREILRGGLEKITECGAVLLGGHTTADSEMKYGLSVNGIVQKSKLWRNDSAHIGDVLVLCKALGSGILSTALKAGEKFNTDLFSHSLSMLNWNASLQAHKYEIHACTDITGFGLIGHCFEMCGKENFTKTILLHTQNIVLFPETLRFANEGFVSGGSYRNKESFERFVEIACSVENEMLFYDVQTSGGLLFALPFSQAQNLVSDLHKAGYEASAIIGEIIPKKQSAIILG